LDSLEKVSPATATVNRSEEEAGVMGGIEMFVRWWYLNGYALLINPNSGAEPGCCTMPWKYLPFHVTGISNKLSCRMCGHRP
ncbi:MAG: hypothetical protein LBT40_18165, partial [Deltaproteobacteria bacterium]|nr:hypothetical protein [Deltaproteobacteria bacterium]